MKRSITAGALVLGLGIGGAVAQTDPAAPDVTEGQLDRFVTAVVEVQEIQMDATARAQTAATEEEGQAIIQEAGEMAATAVEDAGLSVDEYNMILAQVQADPDLLATVQQRIEEAAPQQAQ